MLFQVSDDSVDRVFCISDENVLNFVNAHQELSFANLCWGRTRLKRLVGAVLIGAGDKRLKSFEDLQWRGCGYVKVHFGRTVVRRLLSSLAEGLDFLGVILVLEYSRDNRAQVYCRLLSTGHLGRYF